MGFSKKLAVLWSWFPWKDSFVAVPLASMIFNVVLASLLSQITNKNHQELIDKGLRMIGLVSNASISIVTLTFSLTVLSVQIASQTYSPRLLDDFLKDPVSKLVISVNLGAYAYCYTMVYFIDENGVDPDVPYVSINVLSVHIAIVLVSFINFIHFFINGFRIEKILTRAATSSLQAAEALTAELTTDLSQEDQPDVPKYAVKVQADTSGYITQFKLDRLVAQAQEMDICVRYNHQIGEFVNRGTVLCYVWDAKTRKEKEQKQDGEKDEENDDGDKDEEKEESMDKRVLSCLGNQNNNEENEKRTDEEKVEKALGTFVAQGVSFSQKRNSDLDVTLGIQQLSDIAVRALSPGVNDPHTAIQCMDSLTSLLATLATKELGVPNARDEDGNLRACAPRRSFSYLLSMLDSIRRYGGNDLSVCRRGLRMFGDLGTILTQLERLNIIPTILTQLEQWMVVARENFVKDSSELKSLEEMYDHILRAIAESKYVVLKDGEDVKDLQDFETTYNDENEEGENNGSTQNRVMDFLNQVHFSKIMEE